MGLSRTRKIHRKMIALPLFVPVPVIRLWSFAVPVLLFSLNKLSNQKHFLFDVMSTCVKPAGSRFSFTAEIYFTIQILS